MDVASPTSALLRAATASGGGGRRTTFKFWRDGTTRFVEVLETANLVHEEHDTLVIPPGLYEQLDEREYDYFEEDAFPIAD
jgi:hypothetical protein